MDPIEISELLYQDLGDVGFVPKSDTRLWNGEANITVMTRTDRVEVLWDSYGSAVFGGVETEDAVRPVAAMIQKLVAELLDWVVQP
jgi:hypothetical protein